MDALPPARSWADHTPSRSPLTAASAILLIPGAMASERVKVLDWKVPVSHNSY